MKWGVRKSEYKSADRATRKSIRDEYKKTDEYKDKVARRKVGVTAGLGTVIAGPLGGGLAGIAQSTHQTRKQNPGMKLSDARSKGLSKYGKSLIKGIGVGTAINMTVAATSAAIGMAQLNNLNNQLHQKGIRTPLETKPFSYTDTTIKRYRS